MCAKVSFLFLFSSPLHHSKITKRKRINARHNVWFFSVVGSCTTRRVTTVYFGVLSRWLVEATAWKQKKMKQRRTRFWIINTCFVWLFISRQSNRVARGVETNEPITCSMSFVWKLIGSSQPTTQLNCELFATFLLLRAAAVAQYFLLKYEAVINISTLVIHIEILKLIRIHQPDVIFFPSSSFFYIWKEPKKQCAIHKERERVCVEADGVDKSSFM